MTFFRYILGFILLLSAISCARQNLSEFGKLSFYNSDKQSFSFVVSEEFIKSNTLSKPDQTYPQMTKAERSLLVKLLKNNNYCINKSGKLSFAISSKQEKIYDMTFSNLIEQNYNAHSVAPLTYFGECI